MSVKGEVQLNLLGKTLQPTAGKKPGGGLLCGPGADPERIYAGGW